MTTILWATFGTPPDQGHAMLRDQCAPSSAIAIVNRAVDCDVFVVGEVDADLSLDVVTRSVVCDSA
ncbi:hypothetical protein AB4Y36_35800 [Paraburkholderia sp. BR10936]|uniref:hypothetical protein n=1 Tax=Paraburkholderia sp. BR10936 TaxID=3236993 RepID=UPI0034D2D2F1